MFDSNYYKSSPIWAQEALISARAWARGRLREGRAFRRDSEELARSQWFDAEALARLQAAKLSRVVRHAASRVPYYRDRFAELGLSIGNLQLPRDMFRLPCISKNEVRDAKERLIADGLRAPLIAGSTSGTTGSPTWFHQDLAAIIREHAFIWRRLQWAGFRAGERRAWIRGEPVIPPDVVKPPFWRVNRREHMLMMSSLHLSDTSAGQYIDALAKFDPAVIEAYPSSISFLAAWLDNRGLRYHGSALRSIVTSSEMFDRTQREQVARVFNCKVFDWYGLFERVATIGMCEHGRYHVMSDYAFVEFIPAEDGLHEVVGTSFNNDSMPLIRYRCGDLVKLAPPDEKCACGRAFPMVDEITGRRDDYIKLPDGRRIAACLAGNVFRGVPGVLEGQVQQNRPDVLTVLVVPSRGYNAASEQTLGANVLARLGHSMSFEIVPVSEIPRLGRGAKFKSVVCSI